MWITLNLLSEDNSSAFLAGRFFPKESPEDLKTPKKVYNYEGGKIWQKDIVLNAKNQ